MRDGAQIEEREDLPDCRLVEQSNCDDPIPMNSQGRVAPLRRLETTDELLTSSASASDGRSASIQVL